jgi:hypothetical protein
MRMFRFKEKKVIDQDLTIYDFVRLWFEGCELSDLNTYQPFGFFSSGKWSFTKEDIVKKLTKNSLIVDFKKSEEFKFFHHMMGEAQIEGSGFPKPIKTQSIPNKYISSELTKFYSVKEVVDWLKDSLDEFDYDELPDWAKRYIVEGSELFVTNNDVSDLVDIKTLPKPLRLLVAAHLNVDWKSTNLSTDAGKMQFKRKTEKFIVEKAKEWEVYLDYKKGSHIIGVGSKNIEIITRWIKPDVIHK